MSEYILVIADGSWADHEYVGDEWHRIELNLNNAKMTPLIHCHDCRLDETDDCPVYCARQRTGGIAKRLRTDPFGYCAWSKPRDDAE